MYSQKAASRRRSVYSYGAASARERRQSSQERVRLQQLMVCLALFLAIFLWKDVFPQKLERVRDDLLTLITTDLDFRKALAGLGGSLAEGDTVLSELGAFCAEVFGSDVPEEPVKSIPITLPAPTEDMRDGELRFLSRRMDVTACTAHYADLERYGLAAMPLAEASPMETDSFTEPAAPEEPPAIPAAGTVILASDYSGDALPDNYTMDQLSLGGLETVTPVIGRLNSEYGYRDHPINGRWLFHGGVDIAGNLGDPIAAFAAGTVEYTGQNDSYGLYLQLDHGNGVKSFYAHCSRIVVSKGQTVALGEKVAEIGATGDSTGPHLHLELKYGKIRMNPAYYVDFLEE